MNRVQVQEPLVSYESSSTRCCRDGLDAERTRNTKGSPGICSTGGRRSMRHQFVLPTMRTSRRLVPRIPIVSPIASNRSITAVAVSAAVRLFNAPST